MKTKIYLIAASIIMTMQINAQNVGINSTGAIPNSSAQLDLNTGNTFTSPNGKGLLVPNVSLNTTADNTTVPVGASQQSLLVYNTNGAITGTGAGGKGYYYWDNTSALWINLVDNLSPGAPWFTTGNAGTTPSAAAYGSTVNNNFIGTTDAVDFVIASNNLERMRILSNGKVGIGTATPNSVTDILGSSASRILTVTNNGAGDVIRAYGVGGTMAVGYAALFAYVEPNTNGSGYSIIQANAATQSQMSSSGTLPLYSFGVLGNVYTTGGVPKRNGGVIGTGIYINQWASLGYVSSGGTIAGLYYNNTFGAVTGAGRLSSSASSSEESVFTGVGIVGNSDAFGIIANGGKGGIFVSGEKMGSFTDGVVYTNNISVQLNSNNDSKKIPTFYATSTSVDIQSRGQGRLQNGHVRVNFEEAFIVSVSEQVPVNITITAIGKSNGLYIESIDSKGFDVYENNNGTGNIAFNWFAIGVKKGFEHPELNADVLKPDFESNMKQVSSNEDDPSAVSKPIWWDGKSFRFDSAPPMGTRPFAPSKKHEKQAD